MMIDTLWKMTRPILFSMDAEKAHHLVLDNLCHSKKWAGAILNLDQKPENLRTTLAGLSIESPIGLAAGLDKDGVAIPVWPKLGFGFIEVGTVTAHPQKGNPKPRLFRLKDEKGLINRMGFNNLGSEALASNIRSLREHGLWPDHSHTPIGANIGKSKITPLEEAGEDYRISMERLQGLIDYFTINVSSPNTPGLRDLQSADNLKRLLDIALTAGGDHPVFVKFSPDMNKDDLQAAIQVVIEMGCAGIIATNTTNQRPNNTDRLGQKGGLSGDPLWEISKERIGFVLDVVGERIPVIGVGGVNSVQRAQEYLDMGCQAVQIYSALIYEGPALIHRINNSLQ